jgi:hypothetical protein
LVESTIAVPSLGSVTAGTAAVVAVRIGEVS